MAFESGLAQQYVALWESSDSPPDVFAFLEQHSGSDATEKFAVLLQDLRPIAAELDWGEQRRMWVKLS